MSHALNVKKQRMIGAVLSYLHIGLNLGINLVVSPFLLHYLGDLEYGLYQLVASFFAYITIFESSLASSVLRFYCKAIAANDTDEMENVLAISQRIYRILAVILSAAGCILIFVFRSFYQSSLSDTEMFESTLMLAALIINLVVSMMNAVYAAAITGNERFIFVKGVQVFIQVSQPLVYCLVIMRYPYAVVVVLGQLMVNIVAAVLRRMYAKKKVGVKIILHDQNSTLFKAILTFSSSLLLATIADQIFWKADQIIIGKMFSVALVAVYAIGGHLYISYMNLGTSINLIYFPQISKAYQETEGLKKISSLFVKAGRITFQVLALVLMGFIIFGQEFITLWVGSEYMEAYYVALFVMVPFTIDLIQSVGLSILQIMDKYTFRAKMYFFAALLNIISTIVFCKYMGIRGAALSTGLTMLITSGFVLNWYYAKVGLDIKTFWHNIFSVFVKVVPYGVVMFIANRHLSSYFSGIAGLLAKILVFSAGYLILIFFFTMNQEEKRIVTDLVHIRNRQ